MTTFIKYATGLVVFHFVVSAIHGLAHQIIPIPTSILQYLFIIPIIIISPIVATIMLWRKFINTGTALLFYSMLGALIFGVYNHFIVISPDHISQIPSTSWGKLFQITAVVLAILETLGVGVGLWGLMKKEKLEQIQ